MSKRIIKYAENACEYKTMEIISSQLGSLSRYPKEHYTAIFENYVSSIEGLSLKDQEKLQSEISERLPLCQSAGTSVAKSLINNYSNLTFHIVPFNKEGLKEGVGQKSDINIDIYDNDRLVDTREISLKIYIGKNKKGSMNMQVASGTFFSTLCGLGFDVVGRGSFVDSHGNTFASKKSQMPIILERFEQTYGPTIRPHLNEILTLTNRAHTLRDEPTKPNNIDSIRKGIGTDAISPFVNLLTQMNVNGTLKSKLLERLGLVNSEKKEVVAACFVSGKTTQVFNSIGNKIFHQNITLLNDPESTLSFIASGQGVGFSFKCPNGNDVLTTKMPLTININGAWANEDRWDKLDKCFYKKGQRRVTKSKQLDTSTNFYLDIGQIF